MSEEELVEQSTEETAEVEEETTENSETTEAPTAEEVADLRKKAIAFEDQKKRAEKAEAELKKLKPKPEAPAPSNAADLSNLEKRVVKAELAAAGITHAEDQEFVLGAAKRLGVDPAEAASDPLVAGKLEAMRDARKTTEATPRPSRVGQSSTNVTRLAEKALSSGELPTDPALRAKVREEMKRISKT
jgi:hypothetical protein